MSINSEQRMIATMINMIKWSAGMDHTALYPYEVLGNAFFLHLSSVLEHT